MKVIKIIILLLFLINPILKINDAQNIPILNINTENASKIFVYDISWLDTKNTIKNEEKNKFIFTPPTLKSHKSFLNYIGFKESTNKYDTINKYGFLGKYQFGINTLKGLNINIEPKLFLSDTALQEYAMYKYLKLNKKLLYDYIKKYNNTTIIFNSDTLYITESGILAAAHLSGAGGVKKFFDKYENKIKYNVKDKLGTRLTDYLNMFSGYELAIK
jgi:hypothetical protein